MVLLLVVSLVYPYTAECLCRWTDPLTNEDISAEEENEMKRCGVQAMVITPNAPIVSLRPENNLDMALRSSRVGWRVCPSCLASTTHCHPTLS